MIPFLIDSKRASFEIPCFKVIEPSVLYIATSSNILSLGFCGTKDLNSDCALSTSDSAVDPIGLDSISLKILEHQLTQAVLQLWACLYVLYTACYR